VTKEPTQHKKVMIEAALSAGKLIASRVGKIKRVSYKGKINLVTDVDRSAEELIKRKLKANFSDYQILAEETPSKISGCGYRWIIDPLDGTTNFAHSFPFFCVSIALEHNRRPIMGVVYDPMRGELFWAQEKKGAHLNGKRIKVSDTSRLSSSLLATGFAYEFEKSSSTNIGNFVKFLMVSQAIRRAGSAALDLCYVACGRFDGFWELDLHPWDTAAGSLIAQEAGGKLTALSGSKYSHYNKEICASNGKIHKQMLKVFDKRIDSVLRKVAL